MTRLLPLDARLAREDRIGEIVAPQYDSLAQDGRYQYAMERPDSFLNIVLSRADFPAPPPEAAAITRRAAAHFAGMVERGLLPRHPSPAFFLYELSTDSHRQVGLVAGMPLSAVDDGVVLGHEGVLYERVADLAQFYRVARLTSSPVALAFDASGEHRQLFTGLQATIPIRDFLGWDGVRQRLWAVDDPDDMAAIQTAMESVDAYYITDGHHRVEASLEEGAVPGWFLAVIFPADEMQVLEYNRCVALSKHSDVSAIGGAIGDDWALTELGRAGTVTVRPANVGDISMLVNGVWHRLRFVGQRPDDPVERLDVCLLHQRILAPAFGVLTDQDDRLSFVVGEDATSRLEEVGRSEPNTVAFALHPTSLAELFDVADAGQVMPAKSTWFTPKPRSGLLVVCW